MHSSIQSFALSCQVLLYGGWVAAAGLLLELSCHLFYVHALAVTGVWLEMHQLAGFAIEGSGALSMAALSLGFVLLKVPTKT